MCIRDRSHTVEKKKVGNKIYIKKIASEIDNYTTVSYTHLWKYYQLAIMKLVIL